MSFLLSASRRTLFILFAALALSACDSAEERLGKHYERGMALMEAGSPEKAVLEFRNALKLDENHAPSRYQIAQLYEADGELRAAASNYRLVTELQPDFVEARVRLARLLSNGGAAEEAARHAERALELAPDNPEALSVAATTRYRMNDREGALEAAEAALAADPSLVGANVVVATTLIDDGAYERARDRLAALSAERPDEIIYRLLTIRALEGLGDEEGIIGELQTLAELQPEELAYRETLARLYMRRGDLESAEAELRALTEIDTGNVDRVLDITRFLIATDRREEGRATLEAALAADDNRRRAHTLGMALVEFDLVDGDTAAARERLQGLVETSRPIDADAARLMLAEMALNDDQREEAEELVRTVLDRDSDNVAALAMRASFKIDEYDIEGALSDLRTATNRAPDNPQLHMLIARAHERGGDSALAADAVATAARISQMAPPYALAYVRNLRAAGDIDGAQTVLIDALGRAPDDQDLLVAMGEVQIEREDWLGVEETAERLAAVDGTGTLANRLRVAALTRRGRLSDAITLLEGLASSRASQDSGQISTQLALSHIRAGDTESARRVIEQRLASNPDDLTALLLRAELQLRDNDVEAAEASLRTMIERRPDRAAGYIALARLRGGLGDLDAVEATLQQGTIEAEDPAEAHFMLAQFYEQQGDIDAAIAQYDALYVINPDSVVVANNLASLLSDHRRDNPEALGRAARIAQRLRDAKLPAFKDTYGWITYLNGDPEAALPYLEEAAIGLPNNPVVRYHLGRVQAELGQAAEGRTNLEAALAIDPNFALAASARRTLETLDMPRP